jgi:polyribonucleotide nucleotidyltransferase
VSGHAPRIVTLKVRPDKIREIIGPGGKSFAALSKRPASRSMSKMTAP